MAGENAPQEAAPQQTAETQQAQPQQTTTEWQKQFKTPDDIFKSWSSMKGMHDRSTTELQQLKTELQQLKGQQAPQQPAADPFKDFAQRLDAGIAAGKFSDEMSQQIKQLGLAEDALMELGQLRILKAFEPVVPHLQEKGDPKEIMKAVSANIDEMTHQQIQSLVASGKHRAAAALIDDVLSAVKAKGEPPKVGTVPDHSGVGFKDFDEVLKMRSHPDFQYDSAMQIDFDRRWKATPPSLLQQWQDLYASGGTR